MTSTRNELEAVVQADADFPGAVMNLGVAYTTTGGMADAIHLFQYLLDITPDHPLTILNLGYAYREASNEESAEACFAWYVEHVGPVPPLAG
jgi:Flp pilus assembly protein TadD